MQRPVERSPLDLAQGNTALGRSVLQVGAAVPRDVALAALRTYKRWVSPMLPSACRFHPTCSEYMMEAVDKYGVVRGVGRGLLRLLRCHPLHAGGFDPVR